mgnify:CR=1 FL=1
MPVYEYAAVDARGRAKQGIVSAESPQVARQTLRARRLFVTSLAETATGAAAKGRGEPSTMPFFARRLGRADLLAATQVLATLLEAGLPLDKALGSLIEQMRSGRGRWVFSHILERIREGQEIGRAHV